MHVLVTGGTGFIGRALCARLKAAGHDVTVLSRRPAEVAGICGDGVAGVGSLDEISPATTLDAVINLAGESIADRRWSAARKQQLIDSRLQTTRDLTRFLNDLSEPPVGFISASAVGYYGATGDRELDENSPPVKEFQHELCRRWEEAARSGETAAGRVCILRLGIVLGPEGGALKKMLPAFRLGLGGPIGDGRQWMSWVHRTDVLNMIDFLLADTGQAGVYNATAPTPVMNRQFAQQLGKALGRPAVLPVPGLVLRMALGELSHLLLTGQNVRPRRFLKAGFQYQYPRLDQALADIISS